MKYFKKDYIIKNSILGHNESILKPSCVKALKPDKVKAVACGKSHTIVAMVSGLLWAFGSNAEGQLGKF